MFNLSYPANVLEFVSKITPIVAFDVMDFTTVVNDYIFTFDYESNDKIREKNIMMPLQELGYDGSSFFSNLGFMGQVLAF